MECRGKGRNPRLIPLFGALKLSSRVKCWKNLLSQTRNRNLLLKTDGFLTSIVKHTAALAAQTTLCLQHRENIVIGYQLTIMNIRGGSIRHNSIPVYFPNAAHLRWVC